MGEHYSTVLLHTQSRDVKSWYGLYAVANECAYEQVWHEPVGNNRNQGKASYNSVER